MLNYFIEQFPLQDEPSRTVPHLFLYRDSPIITSAQRAAVGISEPVICALLNDSRPAKQALREAASEYCDRLWGPGNWLPSDRLTVMSTIEDQFGALLKCRPAPIQSRREFERKIEQDRLVIKVDDRIVLDAR